MNKGKIGIFDSGSGGFTVLEELKKILPNEEFLYYKDTKNIPYGNKKSRELFKITDNIVKYLIKNNCKIIVIACNTATTKCIKKLRSKYPNMIFVGTEPAIKMAYDNKSHKTLVMATPTTVKSESAHRLIKMYKGKNQKIILLPCHGLAEAIEENNDQKINNVLNNILNKYINNDIDSIVLGCTHYPLIKDKIIEKFDNEIKIYDGSLGVAKETKKLLMVNNLENDIQQKINIIDSKSI